MRAALFLWICCLTGLLPTRTQAGDTIADRFFEQGLAAYNSGDARQAFFMFSEAAAAAPSSGTLHNLGNAAWKIGAQGSAVLAWEQALWIDPGNDPARESLTYARHTGDLEDPGLRWHEVCSSWIPAPWWPWIAASAFWGALGLMLLPAILRCRRREIYPALAAACAALFLLCLPALAGLHGRASLGFILPPEAPLRLTPTEQAQVLTYLTSGEPSRVSTVHGDYALIQTHYHSGWVRNDEIGLIGRPWKDPRVE